MQTKPSVSFDNTQVAFQDKSNRELLLAYLIFLLTKNPVLVKWLSRSAKLCLDLGLPIKRIIKSTVFKQFCGGESSREYRRVIDTLGRATIGTILDYSVEGSQDEAGFENTTAELLKVIEEAAGDPNIPCSCMKLSAIGDVALFEAVSAGQTLTSAQIDAWERIGARLDTICAAAKRSQKPIYIDAEESWIQGAVDEIAWEMSRQYNKKVPTVINAVQL